MKVKVTIEVGDKVWKNEHIVNDELLQASTNPIKMKSDVLFRLTKATQAAAQEYIRLTEGNNG